MWRVARGVRREASLKAAQEEHKTRVAAITADLEALRTQHAQQQQLYHDSIMAANEQVRPGTGASGAGAPTRFSVNLLRVCC